jgi:hypothetical protein
MHSLPMSTTNAITYIIGMLWYRDSTQLDDAISRQRVDEGKVVKLLLLGGLPFFCSLLIISYITYVIHSI